MKIFCVYLFSYFLIFLLEAAADPRYADTHNDHAASSTKHPEFHVFCVTLKLVNSVAKAGTNKGCNTDDQFHRTTRYPVRAYYMHTEFEENGQNIDCACTHTYIIYPWSLLSLSYL